MFDEIVLDVQAAAGVVKRRRFPLREIESRCDDSGDG